MEHKEAEHPNGHASHNGHISDEHLSREEHINKIRTAGSISMSPELFEKLYLSPQNKVKGDLRQTFGNPTPIALVGFLLSLTPLSCDLMGWRGAGGSGASGIGAYFFFGGLLMFIGGLLEWVLGNSFPSIVFLSFSGFWFTFGATLNPSFAAFASYAPADATSVAEGLQTQGFNAGFGFFLLFMAVMCFIYLICSLRTNIVFFIIFLTLVLTFTLLTGAYWALAADFEGNAAFAGKLVKAGGACAFVTCLAGWWIFAAILLAILDFPLQLPVGDLSQVIRGKSQKLESPA